MDNMYYVESPLQLLSAINAKGIFGGDSILVVNISSDNRVRNAVEIDALINESDWKKVYRHKQYANRYFATILTFIRLLMLFFIYRNKINRYCFGEFRNIDMAILASILNVKESILLDDGSFTITAQRDYIRNDKLPFELNSIGVRIRLLFYRYLFLWKLDDIKKPNLCSIFELNSYLVDGQIDYFTQSPPSNIATDNDVVYYFGSKFSEAGFLQLPSEMKILRSVFSRFDGRIIYYIPHRDESAIKLDAVQDIGFIILELGCPAEVYFNKASVMASTVASCYSTVLYSCFTKFNNVKVVAFDIRKFILPGMAKVNAENIYNYYQDIGIEVNDLSLVDIL